MSSAPELWAASPLSPQQQSRAGREYHGRANDRLGRRALGLPSLSRRFGAGMVQVMRLVSSLMQKDSQCVSLRAFRPHMPFLSCCGAFSGREPGAFCLFRSCARLCSSILLSSKPLLCPRVHPDGFSSRRRYVSERSVGDVIGLAKELLTLNTAQDTGLRKITVTPNDPSRPVS